MALLLETTLGDVVIDLDIEGSPELCKNILQLAQARFYTSTLIFSVVAGRFCHCGDPVGDGSGGTCIYGLLDNSNKYHQSSRRFLASSAGRRLTAAECREKGRVVATCLDNIPNTIGSQFLITLGEGVDQALDGLGEKTFLSLGVVAEDEAGVLEKINEAYTDPRGRPYADIRIRRALVVHDPFEQNSPGMDEYLAKTLVTSQGRVVSSPSPERPLEETVVKRISVEDLGLNEDMNSEDEAELKERLEKEQEEGERRADKSRAVVLEMLGDLPDADIRAPEDVLFICKLNPETMDEDLELIFSRFDEKVKVEVIRDPDTGDSLQYAFAEFTSKKSAEEAYFKMNNALVDDRRIKVDFSQSVSKIWDKYNQKLRMPKSTGRDGSFHPSDTKGRQPEPPRGPAPNDHRGRPSGRDDRHWGSQASRHTHGHQRADGHHHHRNSYSGGRDRDDSTRRRKYEDNRRDRHGERYRDRDERGSREHRSRLDGDRRMERDDRRRYNEPLDRTRISDKRGSRETEKEERSERRRHYDSSDRSSESREHRKRKHRSRSVDSHDKKRERHSRKDDDEHVRHKKHKKDRKHRRKKEKRSRRDRSKSKV